MARLTWKNVDAPDFSDSIRATYLSGQQFSEAFSGLGDIARGIREQNVQGNTQEAKARAMQVLAQAGGGEKGRSALMAEIANGSFGNPRDLNADFFEGLRTMQADALANETSLVDIQGGRIGNNQSQRDLDLFNATFGDNVAQESLATNQMQISNDTSQLALDQDKFAAPITNRGLVRGDELAATRQPGLLDAAQLDNLTMGTDLAVAEATQGDAFAAGIANADSTNRNAVLSNQSELNSIAQEEALQAAITDMTEAWSKGASRTEIEEAINQRFRDQPAQLEIYQKALGQVSDNVFKASPRVVAEVDRELGLLDQQIGQIENDQAMKVAVNGPLKDYKNLIDRSNSSFGDVSPSEIGDTVASELQSVMEAGNISNSKGSIQDIYGTMVEQFGDVLPEPVIAHIMTTTIRRGGARGGAYFGKDLSVAQDDLARRLSELTAGVENDSLASSYDAYVRETAAVSEDRANLARLREDMLAARSASDPDPNRIANIQRRMDALTEKYIQRPEDNDVSGGFDRIVGGVRSIPLTMPDNNAAPNSQRRIPGQRPGPGQ